MFFSGIALVIGLQMFFAGAVVASYSPVARSGRNKYRFLSDPRWPRRAVGLGLLTAGLGLLIDFALFVSWLGNVDVTRPTGVSFGFASLAPDPLDPGWLDGGHRRAGPLRPSVRRDPRTRCGIRVVTEVAEPVTTLFAGPPLRLDAGCGRGVGRRQSA